VASVPFTIATERGAPARKIGSAREVEKSEKETAGGEGDAQAKYDLNETPESATRIAKGQC
jgi:hypothetical protein